MSDLVWNSVLILKVVQNGGSVKFYVIYVRMKTFEEYKLLGNYGLTVKPTTPFDLEVFK